MTAHKAAALDMERAKSPTSFHMIAASPSAMSVIPSRSRRLVHICFESFFSLFHHFLFLTWLVLPLLLSRCFSNLNAAENEL